MFVGLFFLYGEVIFMCVMGRKRDTGAGKQFGSHGPEVLEGALPGVVREREGDGLERRVVVVRPSAWVVRLAIPAMAELPSVEDARGILGMYSVGFDPRSLERRRLLGGRKVSVVYETVEEYIAELPDEVLRLFAWFLDWTANRRGRCRDLPVGFYGQINALKREYPILGRALRVAEQERDAFRRECALERLEVFSEDDGVEVRSSAMRAAEALSGLRQSGNGSSSDGDGSVHGQQVVVNINLDNAFLPCGGDMVEAEGSF